MGEKVDLHVGGCHVATGTEAFAGPTAVAGSRRHAEDTFGGRRLAVLAGAGVLAGLLAVGAAEVQDRLAGNRVNDLSATQPAPQPADDQEAIRLLQQAGTSPKPDKQEQFSISNIDTVSNGPKNPTTWTTREPVLVTSIRTYHWNDGRGASPGSISLKHEDGSVYGPWATMGADGMGGVKNAQWVVDLKVIVKPGAYTVVDSDPATWAQNAGSGQRGFVTIRFRRLGSLLAADPLAYGPVAVAPVVTRIAGSDRVLATDQTVLLGAVENPSFAVRTFFGKVEIAAKDLAGIVPAQDAAGLAWLLLADGQAITGDLADTVLRLKLATGSVLKIPLKEVRECGLRKAEERPAGRTETAADHGDPMIVLLRSGECLVCTDLMEDLSLDTPYGRVTAPAKALLRMAPAYDRLPTRQMTLRNGSRLSGRLLQEKFAMKLQLGPVAAISCRQLVSMARAGEPAEPGDHATISLRNGDVLIGEITDKTLTVRTRFGDVRFEPPRALAIAFDPAVRARLAVRLWDGSVISGQLVEPAETLAVRADGLTLKLPVPEAISIVRTWAVPPEEIIEKIQKLISQLGAESYKTRQAASDSLIKMGRVVIPLLNKHADATDPEVRARVAEILEKLQAESKETPADPRT